MKISGLLLIFGPLVLCISAMVYGSLTSDPWASTVRAVGGLGLLVWVGFAIWVMVSMNTDI